MKRKTTLLAVLLVLLLRGPASDAADDESVTFRYEVSVTQVDDTGGFLADLGIALEVGDVIYGAYTFDPLAPDEAGAPGTEVGLYWSRGPGHLRSVTVGGVRVEVPGTRIIVQNDIPGSGPWADHWFDGYQVYGNALVHEGLVTNQVLDLASVGTDTPFHGGVESDALPLVPPDPAAFNYRNHFGLEFHEGGVVPPVWSLVEGVVTWIGPPIQPVDIDVMPGSATNPINLRSKGTLPVAILGSAVLDVGDVDLATIELAGAPVARRGRGSFQASQEDVDGDGHLDLVLHFEIEALELEPDAEEITLEGALRDGTAIAGTDRVRIRE